MNDWFTAIPFTGAIGLEALALGPVARCRLPANPAFAAADGPARLCEGLIAAAIDQAGSLAVWAAQGTGVPHATVCLGVSFLAPAKGGELRLETRLLGTDAALARTEVLVSEGGDVIARAGVDYALGRFPGAGNPDALPVAVSPVGPRHALPEAPDFSAALGLGGNDDTALPFADWLIGSRDPRALHGGVLAAAAIASARRAAGPGLRLFDVSVDYLRAGLPEVARFHTETISRTRSTALIEVDARQHAGARHVCRTRARFST